MENIPSFHIFDKSRNPIEKGSPLEDPLSVILHFGRQHKKEESKDIERYAKQWGINVRIAQAPNFKDLHVYASPKQKILIVEISDESKKEGLLTEGNWVTLIFTPSESRKKVDLKVRVVRISECANPDEEFGKPTHTVLVEWTDDYNFGTFDGNAGIIFDQQIDNLVICGKPNGDPGSIKDFTDQNFVAQPSDYPTSNVTLDSTTPNAPVIVSVVDTGLWYKTEPDNSGVISSIGTYENPAGNFLDFKTATTPGLTSYDDRLAINKSGYCSVTSYLRASKDSDPVFDAYYRSIADYANLNGKTKNEILNNPYDDNLVKVFDPEKLEGRHGSIISAIINQKGCVPVLPVKSFNCAGWGTMFDLLCSLNYVLACKKEGMNIKVINASFVGRFDPQGFELIRKKFEQLEKHKIWVVVAAGNDGYELKFDNFTTLPNADGEDAVNLFPACFSKMFANVITVTDVNRIATFYEKNGDRSKPFSFLDIKSRKKIMKDIKLNYSHLGWRLGYHFNGNYSGEFTNVAVVSPYPSPCDGELLHGTSFAAAYFSARLAKYLRYNDISPADDSVRQTVIGAITKKDSMLRGFVKNNALLEMDNTPC